jgi:hypothetical protein
MARANELSKSGCVSRVTGIRRKSGSFEVCAAAQPADLLKVSFVREIKKNLETENVLLHFLSKLKIEGTKLSV